MTERPPCAIVLAAGDGSRMRSVAPTFDGTAVPKQFCSVDGKYSLLEMAVARARRCSSRVLVVVAEKHRRFWEPELRGHHPDDVIVQPTNRGTGAGILLPLLHAFSRDSASPIVVFPSDHHVLDEDLLGVSIDKAVRAVSSGELVLLGMEPDSTDSGNGWILPSATSSGEVRRVTGFVERANDAGVDELRATGALWNSLIFAGSPQAMLSLFHNNAGWLLRAFLDAAALNASRAQLTRLYGSMPPCDFFRDILARTPERAMVASVPPCGWSDIGIPARHVVRSLGRAEVPVFSKPETWRLPVIPAMASTQQHA